MIFFFSSRRRHTRWPRDWSSDVCSSDLAPAILLVGPTLGRPLGRKYDLAPARIANLMDRSEERRVGKERRATWARGQRIKTRSTQTTIVQTEISCKQEERACAPATSRRD